MAVHVEIRNTVKCFMCGAFIQLDLKNSKHPNEKYICPDCNLKLGKEYVRREKMDTVDILGTEYKVVYKTAAEDPEMETRGGNIDPTTKTIKLRKYEPAEQRTNDVENMGFTLRNLRRHEIVHGFLYESGLDEYYRDELLVNWLAAQFYKMHEAFVSVGADEKPVIKDRDIKATLDLNTTKFDEAIKAMRDSVKGFASINGISQAEAASSVSACLKGFEEPDTKMPFFRECGRYGCRRVDQDEYDKRASDFEKSMEDVERLFDSPAEDLIERIKESTSARKARADMTPEERHAEIEAFKAYDFSADIKAFEADIEASKTHDYSKKPVSKYMIDHEQYVDLLLDIVENDLRCLYNSLQPRMLITDIKEIVVTIINKINDMKG